MERLGLIVLSHQQFPVKISQKDYIYNLLKGLEPTLQISKGLAVN